jgi:type VI secretion system protein ImpB
MPESLQHVLDRVRKPMVHITYDVEIGNAIQMKEIPFAVGVLADLSGKRDPDKTLSPLKERRFAEIDRDNFNDMLKSIKPALAFETDNKLTGDGDKKIKVKLQFESIEDFHPEKVAEQIEPIKKLLEARKKLSDLLTKLDGNDKLDKLLQDKLDELLQEVINETTKKTSKQENK